MGPQITLHDLARLIALRDTTYALPLERSKTELLPRPPHDPDADPFLPSDDTDDPWETTL